MTPPAHQHDNSESAIVSRLIQQAHAKMPVAVAKYMLSLGFSEADQNRMLSLAERNQSNDLTQDEQTELMNYVRAGHLLTALQSKARKFKSKHAVTRRASDR